jgi:hypothetical protein
MPYRLRSLRGTRKDRSNRSRRPGSIRIKRHVLVGGRRLPEGGSMLLSDAAYEQEKDKIQRLLDAGVAEISEVTLPTLKSAVEKEEEKAPPVKPEKTPAKPKKEDPPADPPAGPPAEEEKPKPAKRTTRGRRKKAEAVAVIEEASE